MRATPAYLDASVPLAMAHRGGATYPPNTGRENTLAAFRTATELGYDYLETDVHVSRDGVVYAFHDADLGRLAGQPLRIAEADAATVDRVRLTGGEPIPRLAAVLTALPEARFNIDVKTDDAVEPTVAVLTAAGALGRVGLAAFSHRRLQRLRRLLPGVTTSASPTEVAVVKLAPAPLRRRLTSPRGPRCLQVPRYHGPVEIVTPGFVARAHDLGLPVHVWTVDDADEMRLLLDRGVDGLISDRIDVLRDVLREREMWKDSR